MYVLSPFLKREAHTMLTIYREFHIIRPGLRRRKLTCSEDIPIFAHNQAILQAPFYFCGHTNVACQTFLKTREFCCRMNTNKEKNISSHWTIIINSSTFFRSNLPWPNQESTVPDYSMSPLQFVRLHGVFSKREHRILRSTYYVRMLQ